MDQLTPADIKVQSVDGFLDNISIFRVDPVGYVLPFGSDFTERLKEAVAWAYNLGYENGFNKGVEGK